jgi:hypothetical protein
MLDVPIPDNQMVTVMVAQTTFAVLTMPGKSFRIDYVEKKEARLKPGMRGEFLSNTEHPLLMAYNTSLVSVYVNSRLPEPDDLLADIQQRIEGVFQGWRDWQWFLNGGAKQLRKNIVDGSGLLMAGAPVPIAQAMIEACEKYGVSTYVHGKMEAQLVKPLHHLLLIGQGYVIAREFRFTEVFTGKAPLPDLSA